MKVSILMPVYNEEKYLEKSIGSLLRQSYPNKELIVLFDKATKDKSKDIINKFREKIKLIELSHIPISQSLNIGLKNTAGDIIFYAEGDCIYKPECIELAVKEFSNPKIGGVAILPKFFDIKTIWGKARAEYQLVRNKWFLENKIPLNWCYFYKKEILKKIGGWNERIKQGEDKELAERIKKAGFKISLPPEILREHAMSDKLNKLSKIGKAAFKEAYLHSLQNYSAEKYTKRFFFIILFFLSLFLFLISLKFVLIPLIILAVVYFINFTHLLPYQSIISFSTFLIMPALSIYISFAYSVGRFYGFIRKKLFNLKEEQREM